MPRHSGGRKSRREWEVARAHEACRPPEQHRCQQQLSDVHPLASFDPMPTKNSDGEGHAKTEQNSLNKTRLCAQRQRETGGKGREQREPPSSSKGRAIYARLTMEDEHERGFPSGMPPPSSSLGHLLAATGQRS